MKPDFQKNMVAASEQLWGRQHSRVPLPNGNSESQLSRKRPVGCCAGAIVHCPTATQNPNCRAKGPLAAAQELGRPNCPMPQIRLPLTSAPFPACPPAQLPNCPMAQIRLPLTSALFPPMGIACWLLRRSHWPLPNGPLAAAQEDPYGNFLLVRQNHI